MCLPSRFLRIERGDAALTRPLVTLQVQGRLPGLTGALEIFLHLLVKRRPTHGPES